MSKCTGCIFKLNVYPNDCFALNSSNSYEGKCPFKKSFESERKELYRCYQKLSGIYSSFDDYLNAINDALQTKFFNKFKDGKINENR